MPEQDGFAIGLEDFFTDLEAEWGIVQDDWSRDHWADAAKRLSRFSKIVNKARRSRGRPPKNYIRHLSKKAGLIESRPTGRPSKYDEEYWLGVYLHVEFFRDLIEDETGKRPSVVAAIRRIAADWGREYGKSESERRVEVERMRRQYSRAKKKIAK